MRVHKILFEWVKGHQDIASHEYDLSPQAVFNINSDELATKYAQTNSLHLNTVCPLLPSTRCHLVINNATITNNMHQQYA
jgi:hypothetical protein